MRGGIFTQAARLAVALTMMGGAAGGVHAKAEFSLRTGAPDGFDELQAARDVVVDVHYGRKLLGQARATVRPGYLKFTDQTEIAELLSGIADANAVRPALAGELPTNADKACSAMHSQACGVLEPAELGIIFHEDLLRVDVFLGPSLARSAQVSKREYIDPSSDGLSWVNSVGGSIAGSFDAAPDYNFQSRTIVGSGRHRFRSNSSYSSDQGLLVDDMVVEADRPDLRLSAGLFWAPGTMLTGRRRILGGGLETQFDTRVGQEQLHANPVSVFLQQSAQVDLLVDGRLAWSQQLEPGNQFLDTSVLPEGSYPVVIRIREAGRVREETRFITKDRAIVPVGETAYRAFVGILSPSSDGGPLSIGRELFYQAGVARRIGFKTGIDANVLGTSDKFIADVGLIQFTRVARLRLGGLLSSSGERGALFQATSTAAGSADFSIDIRRIWGARNGPILPGNSAGFGFSTDGRRHSLAAGTNLLQGNATVGYRLGRANFRLFANYFDTDSAKADYSIGPSIDWLAVQNSRFNLRLEADAQKSRHGSSIYLGIRFLSVSGQLSVNGSSGYRAQRAGEGRNSSGMVGNSEAEFSGITAAGARYSLAAGFDRGTETTSARASTSLYSDRGSFRADLLHSMGQRTNYSVNAYSGLVARKDLNLGGRSVQESAVLVKVEGEREAGEFEVLVNDQVKGRVSTGSTTALFLAPYREYQVRLRSASVVAAQFDASPRAIALYPGSVEQLNWTAVRTFTAFGQLVDAQGQPIAFAQLQGKYGIAQSDDLGYFQLETAPGDEAEIRRSAADLCKVKMNAAPSADGLAAVGKVHCI